MDNVTVKMESPLEMLVFLKTNGTQCRFVAITIDTPVVKIKKVNPFLGVHKVSRKIGLINANYNTSVRRKIAEKMGVELKEVEYENGETWYEHLKTTDGKNLPIVQHKDESKRNGQYYLQYFPHKSENKYVLPNGDPVSDKDIKPWLYKESERDDSKPAVIAVKLENIRQLKASGVIIEMPEFEEAEAILAQ
jgi:hypothetical protein